MSWYSVVVKMTPRRAKCGNCLMEKHLQLAHRKLVTLGAFIPTFCNVYIKVGHQFYPSGFTGPSKEEKSNKLMPLHTWSQYSRNKGVTWHRLKCYVAHDVQCVPVDFKKKKMEKHKQKSFGLLVKYKLISSSAQRIQSSLNTSAPQFDLCRRWVIKSSSKLTKVFPSVVFCNLLAVLHKNVIFMLPEIPRCLTRLWNGVMYLTYTSGASFFMPFSLPQEVEKSYTHAHRRGKDGNVPQRKASM